MLQKKNVKLGDIAKALDVSIVTVSNALQGKKVLFNCQDAVANGQMDPADAGADIQAAIEEYNAK